MEEASSSVKRRVQAQPYSYCTDTKVTTYEHTWTVQNLPLCKVDYVRSSEYSSGDDKKIKWFWELILKHNSKSVFNVYLRFVSGDSYNFIAKVETVINDKKITKTANEGKTIKDTYCECVNMKRDEEDDSVTFNLELTIIEDFKCADVSLPAGRDSNLFELGPILLDDKEFTDVVLAVNGEEFLAHKGVLAHRSSVFRAMLSHEMIESTQNKVTITDIEPKVFEQLLRFIYTDSVADSDMATMAFDLLQAADKYDLETLKTRCEAALCGQISKETAVNTLVLADLYHAKKLKRAAINFIGRNVGVIQTEDWKKLTLKNFELANGVVIELLEGTQLK
ncbi:speckle-type POZ protein B-like [Culex quinquefasciatus]|uniref:speckle-type POZ protein B-like n=1 Tax=Culex quinquefasciatus TaxID=7176 RepID=UPI0018E3A921|nr:speckle-type POZ protein B-like [Culex quinquefasciatus]